MTTAGAAPTDENGHGRDGDEPGSGPALSRCGALRAIGGGVAAGAAPGAAPATARAQSDGTDLGSWFEGVSNYDGVVDETGSDSVTGKVGVEANGGEFGPAAVRVDPGTTVTWRWTGRGGSHNPAADGFESELADSGDFTFGHTFEEAGVSTYVCTPRESLGMNGTAVVVGGQSPPASARTPPHSVDSCSLVDRVGSSRSTSRPPFGVRTTTASKSTA